MSNKYLTEYSLTIDRCRIQLQLRVNSNGAVSHMKKFHYYTKEANHKRYKENREHILKQKKEYASSHREQIAAYMREYIKIWREKNPDKVRQIANKGYINRASWGVSPLNSYFKSSHFHHLHINNNHSVGLYIPKALHESFPHRSSDLISMEKINAVAFEWFLEDLIPQG